MLHGTAESLLAAPELVVRELAHRRVGVAERVHLAEEVREARRVRLTNLLDGVLTKSCGRERVAGLLHGWERLDRPGGFREPADDLDPVEFQRPRGLVSVRKALADEDGRTGTENAA